MTCIPGTTPDGTVFIACLRGKRQSPPYCQWCANPCKRQCDYPVSGATCSAYMCRRHSTVVTPDIGLCPDHKDFAALVQSKEAR